jgi:hypothetical protein
MTQIEIDRIEKSVDAMSPQQRQIAADGWYIEAHMGNGRSKYSAQNKLKELKKKRGNMMTQIEKENFDKWPSN